ncbi:MAG: carbohydrate binding family 9 domain-containing protein, partial [bacterium]
MLSIFCSRRTKHRFIIVGMILLFMFTTSFGFNEDSKPNEDVLTDENGKRYITAVCADEKIRVDGDLDDAAWEDALFQGSFIQREPNEGEPATERTEVGILYDEDNIYFGIKCYDSQPDKIVATEMRRDAMMFNDDTFSIILDTYHDKRSGFFFTTNPYGARRDQVIANEGRNINSAWDGVWTCKAKMNEDGWFAEIAIPWKTLRFAEGDSAVWGVNFSRTIRRKNEDVYWQLIPRQYGFFGMFRLSEAGCIRGIADLKMGGNVELKPYFMGGMEKDLATDFQIKRMNDVGLDAKLALTANLALDLTVNTDFAQVEADQE